jgi:sugar phosphate isomerase/epimerase
MMMRCSSLTLGFGSVLPFSLKERLETAVAGGFSGMTVSPMDLLTWQREGLTTAAIQRACAGAGVRVVAIDPLTKWTPRWEPPPDLSTDDITFCDFETQEVLDLASEFGAGTVSALELLGNEVEPRAGRRAFHALCAEADRVGVRVALEFVPFTGIPDLVSAWELVRDAPPNGGLVVDVWHLFRGPDPERDLELLARLPGGRIFALQLCDAPADAWPDLRAETWTRRRLPGDGAQDVGAVVKAIRMSGAQPLVGPEVLSPETWARSPAELGVVLADATRRALSAGGNSAASVPSV